MNATPDSNKPQETIIVPESKLSSTQALLGGVGGGAFLIVVPLYVITLVVCLLKLNHKKRSKDQRSNITVWKIIIFCMWLFREYIHYDIYFTHTLTFCSAVDLGGETLKVNHEILSQTANN